MEAKWHNFTYKDSNFRFLSPQPTIISNEILVQRTNIEEHIKDNPRFLTSLTPLPIPKKVCPIIKQMYSAAQLCGTGPMAAVAGVIAQFACIKQHLKKPEQNTVVENGGDIFLCTTSPITIGLYAGTSPLSGQLALRIAPSYTPIGICSSSGTMGHSFSMGLCDLATVISEDNALADCAATMAANMIQNEDDLEKAITLLESIPGIRGALLIKDTKIALTGILPEIVKNGDTSLISKITRDKRSQFIYGNL